MSVTANYCLENEINQQRSLLQSLIEDKRKAQSIGVQGLNLGKVSQIKIIACGSSYHAGLLGAHFLEKVSNIPVTTCQGNEFLLKEKPGTSKTLFILISQSGETKDIIECLKFLKDKKCQIMAITNERSATLAKHVKPCHFLDCGKEQSVAATKTFTLTCIYLYLFSLALGTSRGFFKKTQITKGMNNLISLSDTFQSLLLNRKEIDILLNSLKSSPSIICLGSNSDYPIALESALKIREVTARHCEGMTIGEMKHGPMAMLDEKTSIIIILTKNDFLNRNFELINKLISTKAKITILTTLNEVNIPGINKIHFKHQSEDLDPLLINMFTQFLALKMGTQLNIDVDNPKNLTKIVQF